MFPEIKRSLVRAAPVVTAFALIAGNVGLMIKRGLHPNLETAVGFLWIASDYALRQKARYPVLAPRLNAAGVVAGSLLLSFTGIHGNTIDWPRVRTPLGYIPAAAVVGFQQEIREVGARLCASQNRWSKRLGTILQHPYCIAAAINSYGVTELAESAFRRNDMYLIAISTAYGIATIFLALFDFGPKPKAEANT
jgi:hypothetical protein